MRAKAAQVRDRVREHARRQNVLPRVKSPAQTKYRVVAISLYSDQADSVDRATQELLHAGYRKASRSMVIQAAIERLQEDLIGKSREDVLRYFVERQLKRPLSVTQSRKQAQGRQDHSEDSEVGLTGTRPKQSSASKAVGRR